MKRFAGIFAALFFTILALAACATSSGEQAGTAQICVDPRLQACTMDYRPVCGELVEGSQKTYANGCGACSDPSVISWVEDACPE